MDLASYNLQVLYLGKRSFFKKGKNDLFEEINEIEHKIKLV
jgi:hypothetical protein